MPINDLGYRAWEGQRTPEHARWRVICEAGVRQAWRNMGLRRILLFSWGPAVGAVISFFIFEQAISDPRWTQAFRQMLLWLQRQTGTGPVSNEMMVDLVAARHDVWAYIMMVFFRYPQGLAMLVLVGIIGPTLISRDVRSRAFLLYFSRPISRMQYIFGKAAVLACYLALISTVPALMVYVFGVLMSSNLSVILQTWDLPFRIMIASLVLIIPTTSLMLCFSSMTSESRYAGFAWFLVWILGWVAYANLATVDLFSQAANATDSSMLKLASRWTLLSPYHMLGKVQAFVFGIEGLNSPQVLPSIIMLAAVTIVSSAVLFRRISAPMRI